MKKLSFLIIMALLPVVASAYDVYVGGIYYNLSDDEAEVTYKNYDKYADLPYISTYSGDIVIPSSISYGGKTYSVTNIGACAFMGCSVSTVTIPESVTNIGGNAFYKCENLVSVIIPGSVKSIDECAFIYCSSLKSLTIGNGVTRIGNGAFSDCSSLVSVDIPNSVNSIEANAFAECKNLSGVTIPGGVANIGRNAFYGCTNLTSLTIDGGVKSIGEIAFAGCTSLSSVTIPESVTNIGAGAFSDCTMLASVTVPESVVSVGALAFNGTAWLNKQSQGVVYVGGVAYKYKGEMPEGTEISIREGTVQIADEAFIDCTGLTSITIPESLTNIGSSAFSGCKGLTSITLPESVTNIGNAAFGGCSSLTSITLPSSVTNIGKGTFRVCTSLTSVIMPDGVRNIGDEAFDDCISLTSITIPESVTSIGDFAFFGCKNLTSIVIPNNVTNIGVSAFCQCKSLATATLPNSIKSIGEYAFAASDNLKDVYCCAENVPSTRNNAFEESPISTATLHVPEGSVEKYQKSSPWSRFGSIVALAEPESVTYTKDQMATIILPTAPDASKGKYYKLDRCEDGMIVFAQELQPQARTPYIIVPHEDFSIDMSTLDVAGLSPDTVTVGGISFIGSYVRTILPALTGGDGGGSSSSYYDIIDTTPDCLIAQLGAEMSVVGALRAYLMVQWDDPIDHGGPKGPSMEKKRIIILDYGTSIDEIQNSKFEIQNDGEIVNCKSSNSKCFDLSGRCVGNGQLKPGIYVVNGMKILVK